MFQVFLNQLVRYISRRPSPIPHRPEMPPPVALFQLRKFRLQPPGSPTFDAFHKVTDRQLRRIFYVYMYMIFAHNPFQYMQLIRMSALYDQFSTALLNISPKNRMPVLRHPNHMDLQNTYRMPASSLLFHASERTTRV